MQSQWKGPYQFYQCPRACPSCGHGLVSSKRLDWHILKKIYHDLGETCHCVSCNIRFRAFGTVSFLKIFILVAIWSFLGCAVILFLAFWIFKVLWIQWSGVALFLLYLARAHRILFSTAARLWWKETRLERILLYEGEIPRRQDSSG
ncbi:MAG: hypothetical protein HYS08_00625 [Chlamydiae bacterium]|nr:hypothetical protein [Chlamydiota bacterium]MBI3265426.1 hypothetical protein [Chlamydiota bacterium]